MIQCSLTITDQYPFSHFSQKYLKDSCITDLQISLRNTTFFTNSNSVFVKITQHLWHWLYYWKKNTEALDNSQFGICILIDFRKEFDTVPHNILLQKLYHYGIRGNALQWFNSYHSNRYQYVNYSNTSSDMKLITCGVPQGSILGPLLFLLYINDIASVSNLFSILFADDITLFYSWKSLQVLATVVNNELRNVIEWFNANRLSLNIDKTNFIIFKPNGKNENCPTIQINGSSIQEVDNAKFLGITIDNRLNWIEHIKCISRIIAKGTGIIIKARKAFESETLLNLYNSLIFPHLSYGIHVWGTAASVNLNRLHVFQIKIVRIIFGVHPRTHTEPFFKAMNILDIGQIRDYSIALFMYKMSNGMLPSMFEIMFIQTSDVHSYPTRQADLLYVQFAAIKRTQRTIRNFGTKLWNTLGNVIQVDCAISTFKQKLKIFLMSWFFIFFIAFPLFVSFFLRPTSFFHLFLKAFFLTKWPSLRTLHRVPASLF